LGSSQNEILTVSPLQRTLICRDFASSWSLELYLRWRLRRAFTRRCQTTFSRTCEVATIRLAYEMLDAGRRGSSVAIRALSGAKSTLPYRPSLWRARPTGSTRIPESSQAKPPRPGPACHRTSGSATRGKLVRPARRATHRSSVSVRLQPVLAWAIEYQCRLGDGPVSEVARAECADRGRIADACGKY
jgi:hypothetical protein